jgi:hypothetical protein
MKIISAIARWCDCPFTGKPGFWTVELTFDLPSPLGPDDKSSGVDAACRKWAQRRTIAMTQHTRWDDPATVAQGAVAFLGAQYAPLQHEAVSLEEEEHARQRLMQQAETVRLCVEQRQNVMPSDEIVFSED